MRKYPALYGAAVLMIFGVGGCGEAADEIPSRTSRAAISVPPSRTASPAEDRRQEPEAPKKIKVPRFATGRYAALPGQARPSGDGRVIRYRVRIERGLPFDRAAFGAEVNRILNDRRSWGRGRTVFRRTGSGPVRFEVALSSPGLTDRRCLPFNTGGELSCTKDKRNVILNARRWAKGADAYGADVTSYRKYLINHEVGHVLGRSDAACPRRGARAPVMVQQTKSLQGCRRNPWPFPKS